MKFSEICTFAVIYAAYLAARRGKRSRAATAHYEVRLLENIVNLVYILKTKIYRPGVFRVFYLRHSSIKRMRAKLRHWEKEYPAGLVTREQILQSWQAWDAHAAHGNTWALRQQVRDRVQNILKEEI